MAKKTDAPKAGSKFVVLHTKLGHAHNRGDVVDVADLHEDTDWDRLVQVGAVREATPEEAKLGSVTLVGDGSAPPADVASHEQNVARLRAQLEKTQADLSEAQSRLNEQKVLEANREAEQTRPALTELVAAKDKVANDLRAENAQLRAELAAARGQAVGSAGAADADSDAGDAAGDLAAAHTADELRALCAKHKCDVATHATKAEMAQALADKGVKAK